MADKAVLTDTELHNTIRRLEAKVQNVNIAIKRTENDSKHEETLKGALESQIHRLNRAYDFYEKKDLGYLRRFFQAQVILEKSKGKDEFMERFTNVIPQKLSEEEALPDDSTLEENESVISEEMDDEDVEESLLVQELKDIQQKIQKNDENITSINENILNSMKFIAVKVPDLPEFKD